MEENGLQIFIYVVTFVVWIASAIFKARNKQKQKSSRTPAMPTQPPIQQYETVFEEVVQTNFEEIEESTISDKKILEEVLPVRSNRKKERNQTFLGASSYRESIEYRNKAAKRPVKKLIATKTEESEPDSSEIDWKKAVIYSEILRPKF